MILSLNIVTAFFTSSKIFIYNLMTSELIVFLLVDNDDTDGFLFGKNSLLVGFHDIPMLVGYLILNPVYTYKKNIQFVN